MSDALEMKTLCKEYGLKLTEKNTIDSLSLQQLRKIRIAEHAETWIQQQQSNQRTSSTRTGIENRPSKQARINDAIRKHAN